MTVIHFYFAYGSNMNPERVADRGLFTRGETGATLRGFRMLFNKRSTGIPGVGHANIEYDKRRGYRGPLLNKKSLRSAPDDRDRRIFRLNIYFKD